MIAHLNLPQTNNRNRFRLAAALLVTAGFFGLNASVGLSDESPVTLSAALSDKAPVTPGSNVVVEVTADVSVEPDAKGKQWHFYPRKAQHKGVEVPTSITVTSDSSSLIPGDIVWPATKIIRNAAGVFQPVYEGKVTFKIPVSVPTGTQPGDHRLAIAFTYQTCASLCLAPKTENLTVVLTVLPTSPGTTPASASPSDTVMPIVATKKEGPVTVSLSSSAATALPAQAVTLQLQLSIDPLPDDEGVHWHFYPRQSEHQGVEVATSIDVKVPAGFAVGDIIWPAPNVIINAEGQPQPAYDADTTFEIPIHVSDVVQAGKHSIEVSIRYQVCASTCLFPTALTLSTVIDVLPGDATTAVGTEMPVAPPGIAGPPPEIGASDEVSTTADTSADFQTSVFGAKFGFSANSVFAIPMLLLFACVGGFLLNLTPCVLPIIPIKIMGLTQSAAGDPHRAKVLGVAMGAGILAFWLAIGAAISFVSGFDSISSLFQQPVFGITVGLFIAFMGVGMLVDVTIQLPQAVHRINPKHDTLHGAFLFGVMTAVLSTPCTAPFMGSAAAWATKANNSALVIAVFAAIAVGMGWPYVLLSWFPKFVSKVPRTGPASVLVKQVMGLLMLAVAAFFGGTGILGLVKEHPHLGPVLHWWVATIFVGAMSVWLTLQTFRITKSAVKRIGYSFMSLALFSGMAIWSNGETADSWEATEMHQVEKESMRAYVLQLEQAVREESGQQAVQLRSPAWRDYDPEALARVKANGQIAIVHFTADW